jgi:hypothetical protein
MENEKIALKGSFFDGAFERNFVWGGGREGGKEVKE